MITPQAQSITTALMTAARVSRPTWPTIGRLLHEAEITGDWRGSAENFTGWMRDVAGPACGLKETGVWRHLRAFRIYQRLRADFAARGAELPAAEKLRTPISPEGLELLDKLTRVAPREVTDAMALRLVAGTMDRKALRTVWEDYRPALLGRTAQGRGVTAPTVDAHDPRAEAAVMKAQVLSLLRQRTAAWPGACEADVYAVFANVQVPAQIVAKGSDRQTVDAVVLTRCTSSSRAEIHGICICPDPARISGLEALAPYFTQLWVVPRAPELQLLESTPRRRYGLLRLEGDDLMVVAPPRHRAEDGAEMGELAIELLVAVAQAGT